MIQEFQQHLPVPTKVNLAINIWVEVQNSILSFAKWQSCAQSVQGHLVFWVGMVTLRLFLPEAIARR